MIKKNKTKKIIYSGKPAYGYWMRSASYEIAEIAGLLKSDYVIIDNEHGIHDERTLENLIRIADLSEITPIVRVNENRPIAILKALESGAGGVIIPHIDTPEDAKRAIEAAKFAPEGKRGSGAGRSRGYGVINIPNYYNFANNETMVILLIESALAIENIKEISSIKGVDILHIGPSDLAQSMGFIGEPKHPLVEKAIEKVLIAGKESNIAVGASATDPKSAKERLQQGFLFIPIGQNDLKIFGTAFNKMLEELRQF